MMLESSVWEVVMRRFQLIFLLLLTVLVGVSLRGSLRAQSSKSRPGDEPYTPTKLQWVALDLQAQNGNSNWSSETPVMINYLDAGDGTTILCLLQYTPEVPAQVVKINRDAARKVFDTYVAAVGWSWLRIRFDEHVLPK